MIQVTQSKLHWNYFLALERDTEFLSRYIEFATPNFTVYSIELAHILFAAASEVDVIAKLLCQILSPSQPRENINHYRVILTSRLPDLHTMQVFVPRYELVLTPWDSWSGNSVPDWWRSYNKVKHKRDNHFNEATLKNSLNAMGALLVLTYHYYRHKLSPSGGSIISARDATFELEPQSALFRLDDKNYYDALVG